MTAGVKPSLTTPPRTDMNQHGDKPFGAKMTAGVSTSPTSPGDRPSEDSMTAGVTPSPTSPHRCGTPDQHLDEPLKGSMTAGTPTGSTSEQFVGSMRLPGVTREAPRSDSIEAPTPSTLPVTGERLTIRWHGGEYAATVSKVWAATARRCGTFDVRYDTQKDGRTWNGHSLRSEHIATTKPRFPPTEPPRGSIGFQLINVLRHTLSEWQVPHDPSGWCRVDALIKSGAIDGLTISAVTGLADEFGGTRFEIRGEGTDFEIRARHGHSLTGVQMDRITTLVPAEETQAAGIRFLVLSLAKWRAAAKLGYARPSVGRHHLTLSTTELVPAARSEDRVVVSINMQRATEAGLVIRQSSAGVWLTPGPVDMAWVVAASRVRALPQPGVEHIDVPPPVGSLTRQCERCNLEKLHHHFPNRRRGKPTVCSQCLSHPRQSRRKTRQSNRISLTTAESFEPGQPWFSQRSKLIQFWGSVFGQQTMILIDSGADRTFVNLTRVQLPTEIADSSSSPTTLSLTGATGQAESTCRIVRRMRPSVNGVRSTAHEVIAVELPQLKWGVVLGMDWLEAHDPRLSFREKSCTFRDGQGEFQGGMVWLPSTTHGEEAVEEATARASETSQRTGRTDEPRFVSRAHANI